MLTEQRRKQLDGIVQQMSVNKEPDANIRFVVDDFKKKYSNEALQPVKKDPGLFKDLNAPAYDVSGEKLSLSGVGKSAANTAKSLVRFGKDTAQFFNPVETIKKVKSIPGEVKALAKESGGYGKALLSTAKELPKAAYQSVVPPAGQKLLQGKGKEALQSVAEDPYQLAPTFLAAKGGLERTPVGKTKAGQVVDKVISKTGGATINAATNAVKKPTAAVTNLATNLAKFGTSQLTGLSPKTIKTIIDNPKEFSSAKMAEYSREAVGQSVYTKIQERLSDLSETGKGYQTLRESKGNVLVPQGAAEGVLAKYGIRLDANGKVIRNAETAPLKPGDIAAIEDFMSQYGRDSAYSANGFLNTRGALSQMASYDTTKSNVSTALARELRSLYDSFGKEQLQGLKELDATYAPEVKLLNQIKTDYLKPDGTFKDNALTKIANLTNEGRQQVLGRLEQIHPGISEKIAVLRAIEDINNASGQKVGTYTRAAITGAAAYTINPAAIFAAALAEPKLATQVLRGYGRVKGVPAAKVSEIIKKTKEITKDIANSEVNIGLTTKDVIKSANQLKANEVGRKVNELNSRWVQNPTPANKKAYNSALEQYKKLTRRY